MMMEKLVYHSPGRFLTLISVKRLNQPEGHGAAGRITSMKNPVTSSEIETATFGFVA
jgi:hypothetical protein